MLRCCARQPFAPDRLLQEVRGWCTTALNRKVQVVQMSLKEAERYAVIQHVIEHAMGQSDAALWWASRYTRAVDADPRLTQPADFQ